MSQNNDARAQAPAIGTDTERMPVLSRWVRWGVVLCILVLAFFYFRKKIPALEIGVSLGLMLLVLLVLFLRPKHLRPMSGLISGRLSSISIGPVSLVMQDAEYAADSAVSGEEDIDKREADTTSLYELRERLEYKIAFLAKHILVNPETGTVGTFITVGSLRYDGLLGEYEARTADTILTGGYIRASSVENDSKEFLGNANRFVRNFRATVFHALVRKIFETQDPDCVLEGRPDGRFDIITDVFGAKRRVVPVFAKGRNDKAVARQVRRLGDSVGDAIIVLWPNKQSETGQDIGGVKICTLGDLRHKWQDLKL
jgi:hypothetical protein